jgi:hypothetical protein
MTGSLIVRPLTQDGLFGYDQFGQLMLGRHDGYGMVFTFAADVREATCAICSHGWESTGPSIYDQEHWHLIDQRVHRSCLARHLGFRERNDVSGALCAARVRFEKLVAEPNGYYGDNDEWGKHMLWYHADLIEHPYRIRVGHRKRVWEIVLMPHGRVQAVERLADPAKKAIIPFHEEVKIEFEPEGKEGITQSIGERQVLLHAYGTAKMTEYIARLAKVGGLSKPLPEGF